MGRLSRGSFMSRVIGSVGSDMFYVDKEGERGGKKGKENGREKKLDINT